MRCEAIRGMGHTHERPRAFVPTRARSRWCTADPWRAAGGASPVAGPPRSHPSSGTYRWRHIPLADDGLISSSRASMIPPPGTGSGLSLVRGRVG
jgi:hypothetical protein